jgi:hypothetical protein
MMYVRQLQVAIQNCLQDINHTMSGFENVVKLTVQRPNTFMPRKKNKKHQRLRSTCSIGGVGIVKLTELHISLIGMRVLAKRNG